MDKIKITEKSEIKRYEGLEGVQKVTLNSLEAKGNLYIYETRYASLNSIFAKEKADEVRKEFMKRGVHVHEITNQAYHEKYTDVEGHDKIMDIRYVDSAKLKINTEKIIYNDTVAFYTLSDPIYAVEIIDHDLAQMEKEIFEFVWKTGQRPIIGKNGRSSIF